jgi:hypothetical protein
VSPGLLAIFTHVQWDARIAVMDALLPSEKIAGRAIAGAAGNPVQSAA